MDFLTAFPYVGILVLIIVNALVVSRMAVHVSDRPEEEEDEGGET